jgi:hypothetical protein
VSRGELRRVRAAAEQARARRPQFVDWPVDDGG